MDKRAEEDFFGLRAQFNAYRDPPNTAYHSQGYVQQNTMPKYSNRSIRIALEESTDAKQKTPTGENHLQAEKAQRKQNRQGDTALTEESIGPLKG